MNQKAKRSISTIIFTVLLTFVCTGLIAVVNEMTREQIELNKTLFLKRAVRKAAGLETLPPDQLNSWYQSSVATNLQGSFIVDADGEERLVIRQTGAGLWGTIHALVGFSAGRDSFAGFAVQAHNETPGLGARMEEPWFSQQFAGKSGPLTTVNPEPKDKEGGISKGDHVMDAITGATVTTRAVQNLMNRSLAVVSEMEKGAAR